MATTNPSNAQKTNMAAQPPSLPFDIIAGEILTRLPTKTLLRLKLVSKSFKTLISSPEFANHHSLTSSDNHRFLIFSSENHHLYSTDLHSPSPNFRWLFGPLFAVSSCNGLLLLHRYVGHLLSLLVVNPATRTYVLIDIPFSIEYIGRIVYRFGFGFDHLRNDYKIVIVAESNKFGHVIRYVYSLNSKSWNIIEEYRDSMMTTWATVNSLGKGVLVNNRLMHWTAIFHCPMIRPRILCFDIATEKWLDDMLFPSCYYNVRDSYLGYCPDIGVVDGCLFTMFATHVGSRIDYSNLEMWVMKEHGVSDSWIKMFDITMSLGISRFNERFVPVVCRGEGVREVLFLQECTGKMILWYIRDDDKGEVVQLPEFKYKHPCVCEASLVTLPDAKLFTRM